MSTLPRTGPRSVLLVEDDEPHTRRVADYLANHDIRVTHVAAASDVLTAHAHGRHELILLATVLPDGSGVSICQRIRNRSDVPIIMLAARAEEVDLVGIETGADDYIVKPFSPGTLLTRMRELFVPDRAALRLVREQVQGVDENVVRMLLRKALPNVRLRRHPDGCSVSIVGPSMSYLGLDPHLKTTLAQYGLPPNTRGVLSFRRREPAYDLCFEDSWSGYFILDRLRNRSVSSLVLVHVDHHRDMAPALLRKHHGRLYDLANGAEVFPRDPQSFEGALYSGGIGIANFITVLFHAFERVHVRHLSNTVQPTGRFDVMRVTRPVAVCADADHIALRRVEQRMSDAGGTYWESSEVLPLMADLPDGPLMVHIDLDYFLNDHDGGQRPYLPGLAMADALKKMDSFFDGMAAVRSAGRVVEGWIVGTSPGFCGSRHWDELLANLRQRISALES